MTQANDPEGALTRYVAACDDRRGRRADPARAARISAALQPLLALGDRLGPWPDTVPAYLAESEDE